MALFVIVRRRGVKKWLGAIPGRPGIGRKKLSMFARQQVKKGFQFKIINKKQLDMLIKTQGLKGLRRKVKTSVRKKKVKRKRRRRSAKPRA